MIALVADFCSYSKFVHGSFGERELIVSVMGRFYRETRRIVASAGAYLDKYAGDGLLAFWFTDGAVPAEVIASSINECVYQLIGTSLAIAKEWQDRINLAVRPTGMRVGADVGPVLFISEQLDSNPPFHAIGESINLATRLQAAAKPNTLVVSNRLKGAFSLRMQRSINYPGLCVPRTSGKSWRGRKTMRLKTVQDALLLEHLAASTAHLIPPLRKTSVPIAEANGSRIEGG